MHYSSRTLVLCCLALIGLTACDPSRDGKPFNDPYESENRKVHEFNKEVDKALLRPASKVYGQVFTDEDSEQLDRVVNNLAEPGRAVNHLFQFRPGAALRTTIRFALNSTLGFAGINDAAVEFGLPAEETDFEATLYTWGFGEGRYVELPFFGPSTERGAIGIVGDFALDPLGSFVSTRTSNTMRGAKVVELVGDRHQYADVVDGVLYESEDSYASTRLFYLENRRFELSGSVSAEDLEDPYADE